MQTSWLPAANPPLRMMKPRRPITGGVGRVVVVAAAADVSQKIANGNTAQRSVAVNGQVRNDSAPIPTTNSLTIN